MKTAFMFPGQGSQKVGMGKDLFDNFAVARETFEEASEAVGVNLAKLCFEGPERDLTLTENTQPAVLTTSVAALRALQSETGAKPAVVAGHSLGEYSALVCAGALSLADATRIVRLRGRFMQEAVPEGQGAMAAVVGLDAKNVDLICAEVSAGSVGIVSPGNYNSPDQTVLSGDARAVERASALATERGAKRVVPLKVSAPFHSPLMKPAADRLEVELKKVAFHDASVPVIANVDAKSHSKSGDFAALLTDQVTRPVRWSDCVAEMLRLEVELAVEIGPGKVLIGLMRGISKDTRTSNVEDVASLKKTLPLL